MAGVEAWFAPLDPVTLTAGYAYQREQTDTLFTTLDFIMQSNTMSDFSALDLTQISQTVGMNFKASDRFMVHGLFGYNKFSDGHPYMLYDTSGRNTSFMAGFSWIF